MKLKDLKPGDVLRFNYTSPNHHDDSPIILFLDYWQGKVHAINMNYMSQAQRRYYYLLFKVKYDKKKISPLNFYETEIKGKLKQNCYRTYNPKYIKGATLVKTIIVAKHKEKPSQTTTKWM